MTYEYEVLSTNTAPATDFEQTAINPICPNGGIFGKCVNIFSCGGGGTTINGSCPTTNPGCVINQGCPQP